MTTATTPTSELEAVNLLLSVIGESPLSSLLNVTVVDAVIARQVLSEVSRAVQTTGWKFNTERAYPLLPDATSGEITLPANCVRVVPVGSDVAFNVTKRGNRLYDADNHTYSFKRKVTADMVVILEFSELPETARYYIAIRAARVFQARTVGSDALYQFTANDEKLAQIAFKKEEGVTARHNILTDSWSVARTLQR